MPSIEYQGMKFTAGKFFLILSLIGAIIGGGWTGYKFYDDYLDMKAKIEEYTAPDLSSYDEQIAVIKSELDMILDEITLVADVAKDLKNDMKTDLRQMGGAYLYSFDLAVFFYGVGFNLAGLPYSAGFLGKEFLSIKKTFLSSC